MFFLLIFDLVLFKFGLFLAWISYLVWNKVVNKHELQNFYYIMTNVHTPEKLFFDKNKTLKFFGYENDFADFFVDSFDCIPIEVYNLHISK